MDPTFDQQQIVKKLEELDALKAKVEQLISLNNLGQDVKKELDEFKELRSKGVTIPHLEKQFAIGMSWENRSEWHIDHIIPLSSAKTEDEVYKLCHYTNLQPLWAEDNLKKSNKFII